MSDTVTVCFRIPAKADAAMRKLAKASRRSLNAEVIIAIEEHVSANATRKTTLPIANADAYAIRDAVNARVKRLRKGRTVRAKKGRAR